MKILNTIWFGITQTLSSRRYVLLFFVIALIFAVLFVLVPVLSVPGNTPLFQLALFTLVDFVVLGVLTVISSLYMTMQIYVMRTGKKMQGVGGAVGGAFGSLFAGITGTALCASCLAPLFAIFGIGFGGLIFILEYRLYIVAVILGMMFIALYLTALKIKKVCETCGI